VTIFCFDLFRRLSCVNTRRVRRSGHTKNAQWKRAKQHKVVAEVAGYDSDISTMEQNFLDGTAGEDTSMQFYMGDEFEGISPDYSNLTDLRDRVEEALKAKRTGEATAIQRQLVQRGFIGHINQLIFMDGDRTRGSRAAKRLYKKGSPRLYDIIVRVEESTVRFVASAQRADRTVPRPEDKFDLPHVLVSEMAAIVDMDLEGSGRLHAYENFCEFLQDNSAGTPLDRLRVIVDKGVSQFAMRGETISVSQGGSVILEFGDDLRCVVCVDGSAPVARTANKVIGGTELFRRFCALPSSKGLEGNTGFFDKKVYEQYPDECDSIVQAKLARGTAVKNAHNILFAANMTRLVNNGVLMHVSGQIYRIV
jgi:hypothetical protein